MIGSHAVHHAKRAAAGALAVATLGIVAPFLTGGATADALSPIVVASGTAVVTASCSQWQTIFNLPAGDTIQGTIQMATYAPGEYAYVGPPGVGTETTGPKVPFSLTVNPAANGAYPIRACVGHAGEIATVLYTVTRPAITLPVANLPATTLAR